MRRILNRSGSLSSQKETTPRAEVSPRRSTSTNASLDSIDDLQPMFEERHGGSSAAEGSSFFTNDPNLNMNPRIIESKPSSLYTKDSGYMGKSIFSRSRKTLSTKQSSYNSQDSKQQTLSSFTLQPLQILSLQDELGRGDDGKSPSEIASGKLKQVYDDLAYIMNQFNNSSINLTTAVVNSIECFKNFTAFIEKYALVEWNFTSYNNSSVRKIIKIYLHFYDNLLSDEVYIKLKLLLVKNFNDFAQTLNSKDDSHYNNAANQYQFQTIVKPRNFAIGNNDGRSLPNENILLRIIEKISTTSISVKEQNGSFIAPIARGINSNLNILCLYFGYPNPSDYHKKLVQSLHGLYDDIHIVLTKNQIELASTDFAPLSNPMSKLTPNPISKLASLYSKDKVKLKGKEISQPILNHPGPPQSQATKFKLPFRIPTDPESPPISLSLSIENSTRTSGTMGGYIYPIIDIKKQPHFESYSNSKFAISCGHVCLDTTTGTTTTTEYPHVSAPSSVLISLYKQALSAQYQKVLNSGQDDYFVAELAAAYGSVIKQVEDMFPMKRVKVVDPKTKQEKYEFRNLPVNRFGQIIWGERTLINTSKEGTTQEKKLSDLAIIKVNKTLKCDQNYLGDDVPFNEFDPALMFDNLYVRAVIDLQRQSPKALDLEIDEVDSQISDKPQESYNGISVFKFGSTTKYTKGNLNGIKLVYWLDGAIHSSEFIVNSIEHNATFAAGGDSGSWVLTKLEDIEPQSKGLGVLGMLHLYDGEFKQFGLFTPMREILERLQEVTGIKWGVVGVAPEKGKDSDDDDVRSVDSGFNSDGSGVD